MRKSMEKSEQKKIWDISFIITYDWLIGWLIVLQTGWSQVAWSDLDRTMFVGNYQVIRWLRFKFWYIYACGVSPNIRE